MLHNATSSLWAGYWNRNGWSVFKSCPTYQCH